MLLDRDQVIALTPLWEGDRSDDGRPRVPDGVLSALSTATAEHAWAVLDSNGYARQYVGHWVQSRPQRRLVGRAFTCAFVPIRPDHNEAVVQEGARHGFTASGQNSWVIEQLGPGDCMVADMFGKVFNGTVIGDNLGTAIAARTGVGAVIDGGVRDLDGLHELDANYYFRDTDPSPIREVVLRCINDAVTIGGATVLPGDVVMGTERGVTFIPPHLAAAVVEESRKTAHRDIFGKQRLAERVYTTSEIDGRWTDAIEQDYAEWATDHPLEPLPEG